MTVSFLTELLLLFCPLIVKKVKQWLRKIEGATQGDTACEDSL